MINKAIILAAGMGTRLKELTQDKPKCLVKVNGKEILRSNLEKLERNGITEAVILVGYLANKIEETFGESFGNMKLTYVESKRYMETNNMYSLWLARQHLSDGALLMEGDVVFEEEIIQKALTTDADKSFWVVDKFTEELDGCMSTTDMDNRIIDLRIVREKLPEYKSNYHKSVGILKITPKYGQEFSRWLDEDVQAGNVKIYYDLVLQRRLHQLPLYVCSINGLKWFEIDNQEDLKKAEEIFSGEKS